MIFGRRTRTNLPMTTQSTRLRQFDVGPTYSMSALRCMSACCIGPPSCRRLQRIQVMKMERRPTAKRPVGQANRPSAACVSLAYRASWRPFSILNLFTGIFFRVELLENLDFEAGWWFGTYYNVVRYDLPITLIENHVCVSAALNAKIPRRKRWLTLHHSVDLPNCQVSTYRVCLITESSKYTVKARIRCGNPMRHVITWFLLAEQWADRPACMPSQMHTSGLVGWIKSDLALKNNI